MNRLAKICCCCRHADSLCRPCYGSYYVVQDLTKKKCNIVETKPDDQTMVMVGTGPYATKEEAKAARKAAAGCKEEEAN